jgi:hypothetical protein
LWRHDVVPQRLSSKMRTNGSGLVSHIWFTILSTIRDRGAWSISKSGANAGRTRARQRVGRIQATCWVVPWPSSDQAQGLKPWLLPPRAPLQHASPQRSDFQRRCRRQMWDGAPRPLRPAGALDYHNGNAGYLVPNSRRELAKSDTRTRRRARRLSPVLFPQANVAPRLPEWPRRSQPKGLRTPTPEEFPL